MDYEVVRRLARGGMGVVDLARATDGRLVALKRIGLHGTAAEMRLARARSTREVETLRRLDHDAVVPLLDVLDDDGDVVLVMPYLEGGSLSDLVRRDGPLSGRRVRAIADRLLPALASAHRQGIVHRDIKPANVLFDTSGRAHLADFGVATTTDVTDGLTRTGTVLGTAGYLAPEQARGEPATAASDVASLGATLHFAATGRSPYGSGQPAAVLLRTARGRCAVDRSLEPGLRRMLDSMLDPRPDRRPTAAALAGGVDDTDPIPLLGRRRRALAVVAAGVLVLAGAAAAVVAAGDGTTASADERGGPPTTAPCRPLPYRPCGGADAPHTDGTSCIDDHADYDGVATNGCEAAPDDVDGQPLEDRLEATIVPVDDSDRFPVPVEDAGDLGCNNTLRVELVAPEGVALHAALLDEDGDAVGETSSADGVPGEIAVTDPRCFRSDAGVYELVVTPVGSDRTAQPYTVTRSGGF